MNIAVVPARNEQGRIGKVLKMLSNSRVDKIILVINGCNDNTLWEAKSLDIPYVDIIPFKEPLGIDVPRSIGAYKAYKEGADCVIFVDGDMIGNLLPHIDNLLIAVKEAKVDLALTDCYPYGIYSNELTQKIILFRSLLNTNLGIYKKIKVATPSHGLHAVSRRLLENANFRDFAVPPVILAHAVKSKLKVDIATRLPQDMLGSRIKNYSHAKKITDTIIGDSLEALYFFYGLPRKRRYMYLEFQGYNTDRRFDILEDFLLNY